MTSMSRSDIDKMFAEFPSPYLEEHEREVWGQQATAYAASIEDWANKYFYYRFYPNGMAIPDTYEGFTQMLSGTPPREISAKLEFADFSHALQSLKQIKKFKCCAKNFLQIFLAHVFYKWGANVDNILTSSEISAIFPLLEQQNKDSLMNISMQSFKVGNGLFVNEYEVIKAQEPKLVRMPINNVFCCDISGSMWRSLPKMREQLKNRLSSIVEENDTISIIVFADPEDCCVVKEHVHCNNARELAELHKAIDTYLRDQGCTDFYTPLELTRKLIRKGERYNFVFLSDGCHNCCAYSKVLDSLHQLAPEISQCTVIEYGLYADSERLSEMAEILGGTKIPSVDFDAYVPIMEHVFNGNGVAPKLEVELPFNAKAKLTRQFAVYINEATDMVHVSAIDETNKLQLPTNVNKFYTVSRAAVGTISNGKPSDDKALYGLAYVLADKLDYDAVEDVLNATGDTKFIEMYQSSFGKEKLFAFQNELGAAIGDKSKRGKIDPNFKPNTDPYCVVDFFNEISEEEENMIRICSDKFSYNRTGAKTVDKIELTDEEQKKLANAKTASEVQKIMDAAKERQVKMERVDRPYPLSSFVWNEERANLGGLFQIDVKLTLPENKLGLTTVDSFIWRNYTIIKDGIVNMPILPMVVTSSTYAKLLKHPALVLSDVSDVNKDGMREVTVDISKLPVINKKKIKGCKKSVMTNLALQLTDCKFTLNYLKKQLPKDDTVAASPFAQYTQEQADFLATLGITEKGYSPAKEVEKNGDFYMAITLNSDFKGFSKVPSAADIEKKVKAGKALTAAEQYMDGVIKRVEDFIKKAGGNREDVVRSMIEQVTAEKNQYQRDIAQMKFALLVSRKWFADSESFDDNVDKVHSNYGVDMVMEYRFGDKKVNL